MENQINPKIVADDVVVSLQYTLTVDGKVVDSAEKEEERFQLTTLHPAGSSLWGCAADSGNHPLSGDPDNR